ncbi:hypothetical protein BaRGS_00029536 [Batillaria attramentaria]|uniref:C1q domain-containing protein n=1 Tax=Batillaria attramentaria TaxID=370345 RepID=A0ABD0JWZ9_9CAEN
MRETVAFKARLTNDVTTNRKEVLVNNFVMLNIGGGYNNQTGVFTAPVSGLYIFMAKVSNAEEEKTAKVDVVLDNNPIAFAVASGTYDSCTCHAVVKVVAGQKVWLRTFSESSSFCGKWGTAFCGVLIKPEL